MKNKNVTADMTVSETLKLFPQLFPAFQQLGMCCVNPENENLSVAELCARFQTDPDYFLLAVNAMLR